MRCKHLKIKAKLQFNASASIWFQFPIETSIRTSLWPNDALYSTFCEIEFYIDKVQINNIVDVNILVMDIFNFRIGECFNVGIFPNNIGKGVIEEIIDVD